jgi:hypothetical protein
LYDHASGHDKNTYYHELFLRGKQFVAHKIQCIKIKGTGVQKLASLPILILQTVITLLLIQSLLPIWDSPLKMEIRYIICLDLIHHALDIDLRTVDERLQSMTLTGRNPPSVLMGPIVILLTAAGIPTVLPGLGAAKKLEVLELTGSPVEGKRQKSWST